jgi:hypothetical protein
MFLANALQPANRQANTKMLSAVPWAAGKYSRNTLGDFIDPLPRGDPRRTTAAATRVGRKAGGAQAPASIP